MALSPASKESMTDDTTELAPLDETCNLVVAEIEQTHPLADRVRFTRLGLELPPDLTYDECTGLTMYISGRLKFDAVEANLMQMALGDIVQYAESRWGDRYSQFLDATGLAYGTLANAAWVARKVPLSSRNERLAFGHHTAVAPLPPDEQEKWLAMAEQEELGANELRRRIQAEKDIKAGRDPDQAAIERELQRVAGRMADKIDHTLWARVVTAGLVAPLAFKLKSVEAGQFVDKMGDEVWQLSTYAESVNE